MKKYLVAALAMGIAGFAGGAAYAGGSCGPCGGCSEGNEKIASADSTMVAGGAAADNIVEGNRVGQRAPDLTLDDTRGNSHTLSQHLESTPVMIVFYNQDCPFVVEMWDRLDEFTDRYEDSLKVLAIDPGIDKTSEALAEHAEQRTFTILEDRSSQSALDYNASRTPEVFLIDTDGIIQYHGAFDNGQQGSDEDGTRQRYAEDALTAVLNGETPEVRETRAFGCTIKWNPETKAAWDREQQERAGEEAAASGS